MNKYSSNSLIIALDTLFRKGSKVSIDELLNYNLAQRENEICEIAKRVHEKEAEGDRRGAYELLEEKIEHYSSSVKLNNLLAATAYLFSKELDGEERNIVLQNAIRTAERVIKLDDGNTAKTAQARMCIAYCLHDLGMQEQAERIAESMPSMFSSREVMLFRILEGEKRKKQAQINLGFLKELEDEMQEVVSK